MALLEFKGTVSESELSFVVSAENLILVSEEEP